MKTVLAAIVAVALNAAVTWAQPAVPVRDINLTREDFTDPLFTSAGFAVLGALLTTFEDVPPDYWAWSFVEAIAAEGVTTGCAPNQYCSSNSVSRDQMAAFLARTFGLL